MSNIEGVWIQTMQLRWKKPKDSIESLMQVFGGSNPVLQQLYVDKNSGDTKWIDVPREKGSK